MKKRLLNRKKGTHFFYSLCLMLLCTNLGWGQQVIGTFPNMNGGFEGATGSITGVTSNITSWWLQQATGNTVSITNSAGARSGSNYLLDIQSGTTLRRLHSPVSTSNFPAGTYTVQYYFKGDLDGIPALSTMSSGIFFGGTIAASATSAATTTPTTEWTKFVTTVTTAAGADNIIYGTARLNNTLTVNLDDFVVYAGTEDNSAPIASASATFPSVSATQQTVQWDAVADVDGGGYIVVRGIADPATAPMVNGIYAVGNTVAAGEQVVFIGTGTSFNDTGLSASTTYYYRIYAVDKAFNYSAALAVNSTTSSSSFAAEPTAQVTGLNITGVSSTGMTINFTPAVSGGGTNHLVVVGTILSGDPVDGSSYTANTDYTIGGSAVAGGKVVYNGTGNSVTITGLTFNTTYSVRVYDFNGSGGSENYFVTTPTSASQLTDRRTLTSGSSGAWATAATWSPAAVPTQNDNVVIANGHVVTFTGISANACYNLNINTGGQLYNITGTPSYTIGYMGVYGNSIVVDGTFGDAITEYVSGIQFNQNCTLTGSGTTRINRMRPYTTASNATFTFDADATLTNPSGVTMMCENAGSNTIGYKVNSGRTVTSQGSLTGGSSSTTNALFGCSFTVDGTLNANSNIYLNAAIGQSSNLTVNGTLNVKSFSGSGNASGAIPTITVNGPGIINITGTNATADFSNASTAANVTGTGTFALASGSTLSVGAANGLNPTTGPIRCTTRSFNTAATYTFSGTTAQVTGSDLPATVNNLTITNAGGVTLTSATNVNSTLTLNSGVLSGCAANLSLATAAFIVKAGGSLDAAPTFGALINIRYTGPNAIATGFEIPTSNSVLNTLTIATNGGAAVTLASAASVNNKLSLTSGTLITGGLLTLKSNATQTAVVAPVIGTISGNVITERFIPAGHRAYRLLSSPVTTATTMLANWQEGGSGNPLPGYGIHITGNLGTSGFDATTTNQPSLFTHDNLSPAWSPKTTTNFTMNAGDPYLIYIRGSRAATNLDASLGNDATTLRGTGLLATGTVAETNFNATAGGFSLIGNPYQAQVDMNKVLVTNATSVNLAPYYYVVDPKLGTKGAYATVDVVTPGSSTAIDANQYLQPWQACFVQTVADGGASMNFTEADKYEGTQTQVFRTKSAATARLLLTLTDASANALDRVVVAFDASETNAVNQNDAIKLTNFDESMATANSGKLLAIEKRTIPTTADEIPLNISKYRGTSYSLKVEGLGLMETPYLVDNFTGTTTEIPVDGTVDYAYTVDAGNAATSDASRFKLIYAKTLKVIDNAVTGFALYPNPSKSNSFNVIVPQSASKASLTVSSLLGQKLYSQNNLQSGATTITVTNLKTAGVYLVSLTSEGKTATTKWIVE